MKTSTSTGTLRRGVAALFAVGVACAQPSAPPASEVEKKTESGAPLKLEPIEVTGSRVKRLDYETPQPVAIYSAAAIEEKGYQTLGEFVQSLPSNSGAFNTEATTGSFVTAAATINPRGLGSNRMLTLINGRRAVPYALTNSVNGTARSVFNFNSVPSAAIERVEFLKDGASALYGSDAITGVYNIILKKNYSGTVADLYVANTLKHDSLNRTTSVFTGFAARGWQVSLGATYQSRNSIFIQDLGIKTADYRHLGPKGANFLNTIAFPSYVFLSAQQATTAGVGTAGGYYVIRGGAPTANPTKADFINVGTSTAGIPNINRYDPVKDTMHFPERESAGTYGNISGQLLPGITAFVQYGFNRSHTDYESSTGFSTGLQNLTLPATNPYNPFGVSLTTPNAGGTPTFTFRPGTYRPKRVIENSALSMLAGLRGTVLKIWNWETGVSYGSDHTKRINELIRPADLQAALNGTTRATAWNPFGPSENPDWPQKLFTSSVNQDFKMDALGADVSASARVFQIPLESAGEVGIATGYEFRREALRADADTASYLGVSGGVPFRGRRFTHSAYVEISLPLKKWLEVQLAGRNEHYSDFGRTTKPKFSAKLRLPANKVVNVMLRGSYSESFKAPDLGELHQKQIWATTIGTFVDPLRPQDGARTIRSLLGGNPNLQPEEGKVQYVGGVLEVPALPGLSFTVDFFDIKIDNVTSVLGVGYLLSAEGRRLFPDAVVRDNSRENPGPISFVYGLSDNLGYQLYRGMDFGIRYSLPRTRLGSFTFTAEATQNIKRGSDSKQGGGFFSNVGRYFVPEWRRTVGASWRYKTVGAAINADIIGKYYNNGFASPGWGENIYPVISPSINYRGFKNLTLTVGSTNVLDHRPPPNGWVSIGFDDRAYGAGALGRLVYLRARRTF